MPGELSPTTSPEWLRPLVANVERISVAYRRGLPASAWAATGAPDGAAQIIHARREAAVLVLFSGPQSGHDLPESADLLVTVRASALRHHAGQAAFPGGRADAVDTGPVATALREANEETGIDPDRLQPLATLAQIFVPPSGFHVVPVLAYSPDPGPVRVVDDAETAIVARVPVRAFVNPANRLTVYRDVGSRRWAGPAFVLNEMLVWGFTAQVISAMLEVAGWAVPWDAADVRGLDEAMALVGAEAGLPETTERGRR